MAPHTHVAPTAILAILAATGLSEVLARQPALVWMPNRTHRYHRRHKCFSSVWQGQTWRWWHCSCTHGSINALDSHQSLWHRHHAVCDRWGHETWGIIGARHAKCWKLIDEGVRKGCRFGDLCILCSTTIGALPKAKVTIRAIGAIPATSFALDIAAGGGTSVWMTDGTHGRCASTGLVYCACVVGALRQRQNCVGIWTGLCSIGRFRAGRLDHGGVLVFSIDLVGQLSCLA
mmetsp:Transcript_30944/g.72167  ORF Transcript_30944/g.72167 Transcript_30944/m.72167 type:complete len:232 (+) Transcript_30944:723-1418(+)